MQSELVSKVLQQEVLVETILKAVTTSLEARDTFSVQYEAMLRRVGLVTKQQLDELVSELDALTQEAEGLREQLAYAAQSNLELRRRAESAEGELDHVKAELKAAQVKLQATLQSTKKSAAHAAKEDPVADEVEMTWNPTMTKAELIGIARDLGVKVSTKIKKTDLIERLSNLRP
jgi:uncharacterized coiled-coil DUF342 family protein